MSEISSYHVKQERANRWSGKTTLRVLFPPITAIVMQLFNPLPLF